jgi:hypothetical protein
MSIPNFQAKANPTSVTPYATSIVASIRRDHFPSEHKPNCRAHDTNPKSGASKFEFGTHFPAFFFRIVS